tara:strand:- start:811 stop:2634 length:1824 start_codon:yes stop_codon:yes gene_type:complete
MCGIAGYIGFEKLSQTKICRTKDLLINRGPDSQRSLSFSVGETNYELIHSRLSIIDINTRSDQPFTKNNCIIIFNGEIYNYLELRKKLESKGVTFITNSDTEVLLESYAQYGTDCVRHFEGMWSFALFDKRKEILILSRDRFGEKPLFYKKSKKGIFFSSQTSFLHELSGEESEINYNQIYRYLVNGYKSLYKYDATYYEGIFELEPSSTWIIDRNLNIDKNKFWYPKYNPKNISKVEAIEGVRDHLIKSLEIRLRSDVPIGFCLSGGVDSASIASIASKRFNKRIKTFSIIDPHKNYNEEYNIDQTINDLGCESIKIRLNTENMFDRLKNLIDYHDAPIITMSYLTHSMLSEKISENGIKVAFSGTGADELFTGYYDHYNLHLFEMSNNEKFNKVLSDWRKFVGQNVRNPYLKNPKLYFKNQLFRDHIYLNNKIFSDFTTNNFKEDFVETEYTSKSILRNRMMNEMFNETTRPILMQDDLNSMFYSIENRSPYLDSKLFDFCYSIPNHYLIENGFNKNILREAMKGILNDKVRLDRKKKGFNSDISSIFNFQRDKDYILTDSPIFEIIKKNKIEKLLKNKELPNSYGKFIFNFINAKLFLEKRMRK